MKNYTEVAIAKKYCKERFLKILWCVCFVTKERLQQTKDLQSRLQYIERVCTCSKLKCIHYVDTVLNSTPNTNISKKHENRFLLIKLKSLYLGFKFLSCVLKQVTQSLKSEFCKNLGEKSGFDVKVTFCYFCIPS